MTLLANHLPLPMGNLPCVEIAKLGTLTEKLSPMTIQERMDTFGLRQDRAELAVAATMVVDLLAEIYGLERLIVPGTGLREELLFDLTEFDSASSFGELYEASKNFRISAKILKCRVRLASQLYSALWPIHRRYPVAKRICCIQLEARSRTILSIQMPHPLADTNNPMISSRS